VGKRVEGVWGGCVGGGVEGGGVGAVPSLVRKINAPEKKSKIKPTLIRSQPQGEVRGDGRRQKVQEKISLGEGAQGGNRRWDRAY